MQPSVKLRRDAIPFLRIREDVPTWMSWVFGVLPILAILGVWYLVTAGAEAEQRMISPTILPSPIEVVKSFGSAWKS